MLPDPQDRRYPRPGWLRVLRGILSFWWLLLTTYLANVLVNLIVLVAHAGVGAVGNRSTLVRVLLLNRLLPLVLQQPWLLAPMLAVLALFLLAGRWAAADHQREVRVLSLRLFQASASVSAAARVTQVVWQMALQWLRHRILTISLVVASLFVGAILALLGIPMALLSQ